MVPRQPCKKEGAVKHTCNPNIQDWRIETGESLGSASQSVWQNLWDQSWERYPISKTETESSWWGLPTFHLWLHMYIYTNIHLHIISHAYIKETLKYPHYHFCLFFLNIYFYFLCRYMWLSVFISLHHVFDGDPLDKKRC